LETYEQYEAMNQRVVKSRDVGDGRSEVSWLKLYCLANTIL
jgi:hypothetical protein